jgi:hypothetical protein
MVQRAWLFRKWLKIVLNLFWHGLIMDLFDEHILAARDKTRKDAAES